LGGWGWGLGFMGYVVSDNIKNIITSKFKENLWCDKKLEDKIKLRYYKEVVNPNLEDKKYLSILTIVKKKINISKIRTNSHELYTKNRNWIVSKTPWIGRIYRLCDTKKVEDEKCFLLECPMYTQIRS
jgi:hypothetical protein